MAIFYYLCDEDKQKNATMDDFLFIGRKRELALIKEFMDSPDSEFIAIYGRRRVGKTLLIRRAVNDQFTFSLTGMDNVSMQEQLLNFAVALRHASGVERPVPKNWLLAFVQLSDYIETLPTGRKTVFIDELPWLDTHKSSFVPALEHFWNSWASRRNDIKLIVCGSATSWMVDKLINNRGGLHNRITQRLRLEPFTLAECEEYFNHRQFSYGRQEIAECYMVMGGIPFYLSKMKRGLSVAQNIDRIFFAPDAALCGEFQNLYHALFKYSDKHIKVVTALARKQKGLTRKEIVQASGLANNGALSKVLSELENCGFIRHYAPFGKKQNDGLFQLVDFYSLFYFHFIAKNAYADEAFWTHSLQSALHRSWSGYAFEMLCLSHIKQMKQALGISGVQSRVSSWVGRADDEGAQIDLLIDRADSTINICEMKYAADIYEMNKSTEKEMRRKMSVFSAATHTRKSLMLTLVTTIGLKQNAHSGLIQQVLTLNDLFSA